MSEGQLWTASTLPQEAALGASTQSFLRARQHGVRLFTVCAQGSVLPVAACRCSPCCGQLSSCVLLHKRGADDGLHYDALAVSALEGAPEQLDVTVMKVSAGHAWRGGEGVQAYTCKGSMICQTAAKRKSSS